MTDQTTPTEPRPLALVTGASSGIGRELAHQFVAHGFDVLVTAEDAGIESSAEELRRQGAQVHCVQSDLATPEGVDAVHRAVKALGRPVAAAALNAGAGVAGPFVQTSLEEDLRLVGLNVASTVHLAKLLLRDMVARDEGKVLVTASIAATMPGPFNATYSASKAFVHSFAVALHDELRETGVSVTSLMPGPTDTEFFDRAGMQGTRVDEGPKDDPREVAEEGFAALMAGKDHVVSGATRNSLQAAAAGVLPDRTTARLHRRLNEPGGAG